jgi:peptidylprolyl isomerase
VHYDNSPFTNSWERRKPFRLVLGGNSYMVNPGWEKGLPGMRLGGRRELIIPPDLLYAGGAPPGSKPADTLVYMIDLVALERH